MYARYCKFSLMQFKPFSELDLFESENEQIISAWENFVELNENKNVSGLKEHLRDAYLDDVVKKMD